MPRSSNRKRVRGRPWRRGGSRLSWALLGSGGAFLLGIIIYGLFTTSAVERSLETAPAPTMAPDVAFVTADGEFRLADHRGRVVLLYFSFPG